MGLVFTENEALIKAYPDEQLSVEDALITVGQEAVEVGVAAVSEKEVRAYLNKIDLLTHSKQNEAIAIAVADAFPTLLTALRMVKKESKQPYRGIKGSGAALDLEFLIPEHVGGTILNPVATSAKGLYGGTNAAVRTWLQTFVAGTSDDIIPSQVMKEEAAVVHIGAIDTVEVPKINRIKFTLSGVATPAQTVQHNITNGSDVPFAKWEMPVLVPPEGTQLVEVDPYIDGDSKFELISFLIAKAEDLTF